MIKKFIKNKTVKNAGWLISGKIAQMLINLLVGLLTARYLGPSNYGLINYAAAYIGFFTAFCTLGINSIIVKEFVDNPEKEGEIIGTTIGLRAISSFLSVITIFAVVNIIDASETETILVVSLSSIGLVFDVFGTINYWFQYRLQSKVSAIVTFIAYAITAAYKVFLIVTGKGVVPFALATSIDYICVGTLLFIAYKKSGGADFSFSWEYGKKMLSKSCHFILPGLMVAIYAQTDKIMLKQMISEAEIGFYATAVSISGIWCFVLSAIIDSVYPSIMKANNESEELFVKRNKQLYAMIFYISVFVSLMFTVFAELVINIMYGREFLSAVAPLRIITWYTAFSYLGVARNAWIVCKNRQKKLIYVYALSALSNVLLNIILIPKLGASGAAIASLVAQIMTTMIIPFFMKDFRENSKLILDAIFFK